MIEGECVIWLLKSAQNNKNLIRAAAARVSADIFLVLQAINKYFFMISIRERSND